MFSNYIHDGSNETHKLDVPLHTGDRLEFFTADPTRFSVVVWTKSLVLSKVIIAIKILIAFCAVIVFGGVFLMTLHLFLGVERGSAISVCALEALDRLELGHDGSNRWMAESV